MSVQLSDVGPVWPDERIDDYYAAPPEKDVEQTGFDFIAGEHRGVGMEDPALLAEMMANLDLLPYADMFQHGRSQRDQEAASMPGARDLAKLLARMRARALAQEYGKGRGAVHGTHGQTLLGYVDEDRDAYEVALRTRATMLRGERSQMEKWRVDRKLGNQRLDSLRAIALLRRLPVSTIHLMFSPIRLPVTQEDRRRREIAAETWIRFMESGALGRS